MLTVLAEIRVVPGKADEAKGAFRTLAEAVRTSEPGTIAYHVYQRQDDPHCFVVWEQYRDQAAFQEHAANLPVHGNQLVPLIDGTPRVVFLNPVAA